MSGAGIAVRHLELPGLTIAGACLCLTATRLIVYVTAHGTPGAKDDSFDTSIDCWDSKKITARDCTKES